MSVSAPDINAWIRQRVAALLDLDPLVIRDDEAVTRYGLDSAGATRLIAELGAWLGRKISPVLAFEHPTIAALSQYLAGPAERPRPRRHGSAPSSIASDEPIAVVGIACRFPGASDHGQMWQSLCSGQHQVREVDDGRWPIARFHAESTQAPGRAHTRWASLLEDDDLAHFDPLFFNISPREAEEIDPQQRVFLELSWEALQDAGIRPFELRGSRTGVFVGVIWADYGQLAERDAAAISMHTATGKARAMVPNRVSYTFGLQGPSVSIDTACSSSLVVVHLGCQSLLSGDSDLVVVGGVNLMIDPLTMVGLSKFGGLSSGSKCRAFDEGADGFVRGEGGGAVVLKRLSRAIADGDHVYALVRGSAINNDGASNGLTAPNPQAQEDVLERAWARAGIDTGEVDYVEAHGTGTVLGDPIEAKALGTIFGGELRPRTRPLRVGSVKTNIGHLEAAAGIAGFIKTVLSLDHGMLPPSLHVERLNPHIPFDELRLTVQTDLEPWPSREDGGPRRAGVSAFGWGGTNCHVALESARRPNAVRQWRLAGTDEVSLRAAVDAWEPECGVVGEGPRRIALTTDDPRVLPELLDAALEARARPEVAYGEVEPTPLLAFVCSPQGGQWRGMARSLLAGQPVFREAMQELHEAYAAHAPWSLLDALTRDDAGWAWERVHTIQPMILAVQVSLAALWRSWGITPDLYVGHSLGELTAAHLSGALDLDDVARLVIHYARLQATTDPEGTMAIVGLDLETVQGRIEGLEGVVIAGHNGPQSVVLSGLRPQLEPVLAAMQAEEIFARFVDVNVAAHSPRIDPIMEELQRELAPLRPRVAHTPMISSLWCREVAGPELGAEYWPQNLRERVNFAEAIDLLAQRGVTAIVELNPHPILLPSVRQCLDKRGHRALALESTRKGEDETRAMMEGLGRLFATGHDPSRRRRYRAAPRRDLAVLEDPAEAVAAGSIAVPTTARSAGGLRALNEDLGRRCELESKRSLHDVARGLARCDGAFSHRRVAVLGLGEPSASAFGCEHSAAVLGQVDPHRRRKVVFVCPGQGSQWKGMARDLLATQPLFHDTIARIDRVARTHMQRSLLDELLEPGPEPWPIDVVQPLLFAVEVALGELWRSWGIEPDAIVGHSMGEVAAFHLAGALSLEDAVRVICLRSRLLAQTSGRGAMLAAELSADQAREWVAGHERSVAIAVDNSSSSIVFSGDAEVLEEIRGQLDSQGIFCRFVKVDVASHSPQMDPLLDELRVLLEGVKSRRGQVTVYSTVRATPVDGEGIDTEYWIANLRQTVRFGESIQQLIADGHDLFIELSPHPILLTAVEQGIDVSGDSNVRTVASMRRDEPGMAVMLEGAAQVFALGHELRWSRTMPGGPAAPLVGSPWERDHYWLPTAGGDAVTGAGWAQGKHPLLGEHIDNALDPRLHLWHLDLAVNGFPWLADHRVADSTVVSVTVSLQMLMVALSERFGSTVALEQLRFEHPLILPERGSRTIQVALREIPETPGRGTLGVFSRGVGDQGWIPHVQGCFAPQPLAGSQREADLDRVLESLGGEPQEIESFYCSQADRGIVFGPAFQAIRRLEVGSGEALAQVVLPRAVALGCEALQVHPVVLDGALQVVLAALGEGDETFLSVGIDRILLLKDVLPDSIWSHARVVEASSSKVRAEVVVYDEEGAEVVRIEGLRLARVADEFLSGAPRSQASTTVDINERLRAEAPGVIRRACFEALVREQVGQVLKIPDDRIDPRRPLQAMGITSLMTIELRNRLGALLGTRLPATLAWNYPTLEAVVGFLASKLTISLDDEAIEAERDESEPEPKSEVVASSVQIEGIDAELLEELSRVDSLLASM